MSAWPCRPIFSYTALREKRDLMGTCALCSNNVIFKSSKDGGVGLAEVQEKVFYKEAGTKYKMAEDWVLLCSCRVLIPLALF